jgi:hypothetical protein
VTHSYIEFERLSVRNGMVGFLISGSSVTLRSVTCLSNRTAIQMTAGSVTMLGGSIRGSASSALNVSGGTLTVQTATIHSNTGGILSTSGSGSIALRQCTVRDNASALFTVPAGTITMANCLVLRGQGGTVSGPGTARIYNCTFSAMTSTVLTSTAGNSTFVNCIVNNSPGALAQTGGTLTHTNNIFWQVTTELSGTARHSTERTIDPLFVSSTSFTLQNSSPAIDQGVNATSITTVDRSGALRPRGLYYDIGAYEVTGASASLPYFANFDSGTAGAEWNTTNVTNLVGLFSSLGRALGPFANSSAQVRVRTTVGTNYSVIFDAYLMATWDGNHSVYGPDFFGVTIDGEQVFRETYDRIWYPYAHSWPDFPEMWYPYGRDGGGIFRRVSVEFTADNSVTYIGFFGENLQGWPDEGWYVDNVRVVTAATAAQYLPNFVEVGRVRRQVVSLRLGGISPILWGDLNADGWLDSLTIDSTSGRPVVHISSDVGSTETTLDLALRNQSALADLDNDGDLDLISGDVSNRPFIYENRGPTSPSALVPRWNITTAPHDGLAILDMDCDGICDINSVGTSSWWLGRGTITDSVPSFTTDYTIMPTAAPGDGHFISSADANNDGRQDLFLHSGTGALYLSQPDGTYVRSTLATGLTFTDSAKVGSAWGDYNNDNQMDLLIANRGGTPVLLRNNGDAGSFTQVASSLGLTATGTVSACFGDVDNDGDLDIFMTTASASSILYLNAGAPTYAFTAVEDGCTTQTFGGDCQFIDFNNDGQLDVSYSSFHSVANSRLYKNLRTSTSYLKVRVVGVGRGGMNAAGIGCRVELWSADGSTFLHRREIGVPRGYGGQEPLWAHFGGVNRTGTYTLKFIYGPRTHTATVTPSAATTTIGAVSISQMYTFTEPLGLKVNQWQEVAGEPPQ